VTALDHVFICCAEGAPEAEALVSLGFREGSGNTHPGQGTANRRFFFHNAYLELVWVTDREEAGSEAARPTRLLERWSRRGVEACPFGVIVRPDGGEPAEAPFDIDAYRPSYLPAPLSIDIARDTPLREPGLFFMSFGRSPETIGREATTHPNGASRLTGVEIGLPGREPLSRAAATLQARGVASFQAADAWVLSLTFDHASPGLGADLRPALPLVLRW
jgi:Glyoxalase-like domain